MCDGYVKLHCAGFHDLCQQYDCDLVEHMSCLCNAARNREE